MNSNVDEMEDTVATMQREIELLKATNSLLFETITVMAQGLETANQHITELQGGLTDTSETVYGLENGLLGRFSNSVTVLN